VAIAHSTDVFHRSESDNSQLSFCPVRIENEDLTFKTFLEMIPKLPPSANIRACFAALVYLKSKV